MSASTPVPAPRRAPATRTLEWVLVVLFVSAMAAANLAISAFGPWFLPVTAFFSVGIVLVSRDYLHDVWRDRRVGFWPRMLGMIAAAAALSFLVDQSSLRIGLASTAALASSALMETLVFERVLEKKWLIRSNTSNVAGALTDSLVFPIVAFGLGMPGLILLVLTQAGTKALGGLFWSAVARAVIDPDKRRHRRRAALRAAGTPSGTPVTPQSPDVAALDGADTAGSDKVV